MSALIAAVLSAHARKARPDLPHPKGLSAEAIRELCRIGNNLNQIAHAANSMRLHMTEKSALDSIALVNEAVRRLGA